MISIAVYFSCCLYVDSPFKLNKVVYTISKCDALSSLESGFGSNCFTYFQLKFLKFQACNGKSPCKLQRRKAENYTGKRVQELTDSSTVDA